MTRPTAAALVRFKAEEVTVSRSALDVCQHLDWDSEFFGCRIGRVNVRRLDPFTAQRILEWCKQHDTNCLYFLADADDDCTIRIAEQHGFHFVDIRMKFDIALNATQPGKEGKTLIRPFESRDLCCLKTIARESYQSTRFYYDSGFSKPLADKLYETWIEKSCTGYADAVLVAELKGNPVGYVTCHLDSESSGHIGLVGVSKECNRIGLGQSLVYESLGWFVKQGISSVEVVTQGRNCQAQRLYERCGFVIRELSLWYHLWLTPSLG